MHFIMVGFLCRIISICFTPYVLNHVQCENEATTLNNYV
jgi:hypothetical protein